MKIAIITSPDEPEHEAEIITRLFQSGLKRLHLRKPLFSIEQTQAFIQKIPKQYYKRIILHHHHCLAVAGNLKGIHYTENQRAREHDTVRRVRRQHPDLHQSASFHDIDDIKNQGIVFDDLFLSPVFDSISKKNHRASFNPSVLKRFLKITDCKVFALGGINEDRVRLAAALGFSGVGILGGIWCQKDPVSAFLKIQKAADKCRGAFT